MAILLQDVGGGQAIAPAISSSTSTTSSAWGTSQSVAFTAIGRTLTLPAITDSDLAPFAKPITIHNSGTLTFTLALSGGTLTSPAGLLVSPGSVWTIEPQTTTSALVKGTNADETTITHISVAYGDAIPLSSISADGTYFITAGSGLMDNANVAYGIPILPPGSTLTIFGSDKNTTVVNTVWSAPYTFLFKQGSVYTVTNAAENASNLRWVPSTSVSGVFTNIGFGERLFGVSNSWEALNHGKTLLFQLATASTYQALLDAYNSASGAGSALVDLQLSINGSAFASAVLTDVLPIGLYTFQSTSTNAYLTQISAGGASSPTLVVQSLTSGAAVTIANNVNLLKVNPAAVLPALAITLPNASYAQGFELNIKFGGTLALFGQVVTALSIVAPAGTTLDGAGLTPTEAISGDTIAYALTGTVWTRIY